MQVGSWQYHPGWYSSIATIAILGLLIYLGVWQLGRSEEKLALEQRASSGRSAVLLSLDGSASDLQAFMYHPVAASGRYDSKHQFLLDNRTHDGVAGYHVLTPLIIDAGGTAVLVNRGWVPVGARRDRLPALPLSQNTVSIIGTLAPPPRVFLLGAAGYAHAGWPKVVQAVDVEQIQLSLDYRVLTMTIRLDPGEPEGFVREWQAYYGISPDRHRAYAVQWFALAIALVIIYLVMTVKRVPDGDRDER